MTSGYEEILRRVWPDEASSVEVLGGGITNHNLKVSRADGVFVLRVSGANTELLGIDRAVELEATRAAAAVGVGPEVVAWLNQQEERWPFVIYETDATWSAWTNRCLRQADRILLVADAEDDPARCELEVEWENERTRKSGAVTDLVLLHLYVN